LPASAPRNHRPPAPPRRTACGGVPGICARGWAAVRSVETAADDDACALAARNFAGVFVIRPPHNPLGPFDFGGVYDDASDRRRQARELLQQGYEDAYAAFIDPFVAAGERLEP
jgi:hypothetical protein